MMSIGFMFSILNLVLFCVILSKFFFIKNYPVLVSFCVAQLILAAIIMVYDASVNNLFGAILDLVVLILAIFEIQTIKEK